MHCGHMHRLQTVPNAITFRAAPVPTAQLRWSACNATTTGSIQRRMHTALSLNRRVPVAHSYPPSGILRSARGHRQCQRCAAENSEQSEQSEESQKVIIDQQLSEARPCPYIDVVTCIMACAVPTTTTTRDGTIHSECEPRVNIPHRNPFLQVNDLIRVRQASMAAAVAAEDYQSAASERDVLDSLLLRQRRLELVQGEESRKVRYKLGVCISSQKTLVQMLTTSSCLTLVNV